MGNLKKQILILIPLDEQAALSEELEAPHPIYLVPEIVGIGVQKIRGTDLRLVKISEY